MSTEAKADPVRAQTNAERLRDGCRDLMAGFMEAEEQRALGRLLYDASLWDHNPLAGLSPMSRPAALAQQAGASEPVPGDALGQMIRAGSTLAAAACNLVHGFGGKVTPECGETLRNAYEQWDAALGQDLAPQAAIPEWFDDVLRCLQDVATEFRARGRDDRRFEQLTNRMLAKRSWEGE